jgi:hypothetical protein
VELRVNELLKSAAVGSEIEKPQLLAIYLP